MKTFNKAFYFPLLFLFSIIFPISALAVIQPFTVVNPSSTKNVQGNYAIAGNTVMCLTEKTSGYGGTCHGMTDYAEITSNMHVSKYIDIDSDGATWNSTSSYITFPTTLETSVVGESVLWAGLFWQGRISNSTTYVMHYGEENATSGGFDLVETGNGVVYGDVDLSTTGAHDIKLKVDNGSYSDVTQDTFYTTGDNNARTYAAYSDVTSIVKAGVLTSGKHTFTVANLTTNEGRESSPGVFGGWSLVVIYAEDVFGKMRNISIYSGFDDIEEPSPAFTITDFLLPLENSVNATLSLFSGEGEYLYGYKPTSTGNHDWVKISNDGVTYTTMPGATHPNNVFDGVFTGVSRDDVTGHSNNLQINNDGVDIDSFDVSTLMTAYRDVDPELHTLYIQWSSDWDYITPSMIAFATELYVPEFCYDYGYKQEGKYFTEENDGTNNPRITGNVLPGEEIEVTLFLRNLVVSDIEVKDLQFNILDINASAAPYILGTTSKAQIPTIIPTPIADSGTTTQTDITDIMIGDMGSNDYFYIYYKLDPKKSTLDEPINATATYHLELDSGDQINYELKLGAHISMCRTSNYDYEPTKGLFNIVHQDYYSNGGYYNLPTQIASREGNFQVLSMDPDNLDTVKAVPSGVIVGVQLIDVSAFHDTFTACKELESAIGPKLWVVFDANKTSTLFDQAFLAAAASKENNLSLATGIPSRLVNSYDFYKTANENTAFRVSYNKVPDTDFVLSFDGNATDGFSVHNFEEIKGITCSDPAGVYYFDKNGNPKTGVKQANTACGNASGTPLGESQFMACMECLYGINTELVCSRDNFSIRPEAFLIKLNDQDQTNPAPMIKIGDDVSGVLAPSGIKLDMAAGYQYYVETNATNHRNNEATPGYTKTYGITNADKYLYKWDSNNSACNDETDHRLDIRYLEGRAEMNTSIDQVGLYKLGQIDKEWTTVDNDLTHMAHHTVANGFLVGVTDCISDSSVTQITNATTLAATPLQGCDISSQHDSSVGATTATNLKYRDYGLELHPYSFDLTGITSSTGLTHDAINANSFVYMSDMSVSSVDENMSYHLNGTIRAAGENNVSLSNFVNNCYAKPLSIDLNTDPLNQPVPYQFRFHSVDTAGADINTHDDNITGTSTIINLAVADFPKALSGLANTILNLNYDRNNSFEVNPEEVTFNNYNVDCTNAATDCTFNADLDNNKTAQGRENFNNTVKYYYGRTHAPRNRFVGPGPHSAFIYYEVFCNGTTVGGSTCDKTLLQNGLSSVVTDDPRWFRNQAHVVASNGSAGLANGSDITQKNAANVATGALNNAAAGQTTAPLTYNENRGYPYKATMQNNASRFLIYNRYDITNTNTLNEFEVEFVNSANTWAGQKTTNTRTFDTSSKKTNRRSMW